MEKPRSEIERLEGIAQAGPKIQISSLADIGGGGAFMPNADVDKQILTEIQKITAIATQGVQITRPGNPDANF